MTIDELEQVLGVGERQDATVRWLAGTLRVDFDESEGAEFIEVSRGGSVRPLFRELDVFATPANNVVARLERVAPYDKEDPEVGYSYWFPQLQLGLWRPSLEGDRPDDESFFATVSIATAGYYD